ncbi:MAG: non-ribosomal peptide synthetase [Gammaproteobacteria bacterium]|nr:non-ribosomal peptide synthetase [Gammaproteobacteria bacterium]MDH5801172.1 non-ribosomal peptide synthetase [Gammaproteobacteria bacterium]
MTFPTTLIEAIQQNKTEQNKITFIHGFNSETHLSYPQLYEKALQRLWVFQSRGIQEDHHVIIHSNDLQEFLISFWACILGGIVAVPVAVGISDEHRGKLVRIFKRLNHAQLVTNEKQIDMLLKFLDAKPDLDLSPKQLRDAAILLEQLPAEGDKAEPAAITPDRIAFIQFSSGSTREPKGIMLSHANLLACTKASGDRNGYSDKETFLSWMPLTHDMGLIGFHLFPTAYGMSHYLIPTDLFSRRPLIWLKKASEHRATVINSPNFGYKHYLKAYRNKPDTTLDLSNVRYIYNGAEPISVDLCEDFMQTMQASGLAEQSMQPVYGLAEATLTVTMPEPDTGLKYVCVDRHQLKIGDRIKPAERSDPDSLAFVIEGPNIDSCEIKITDEDNNRLDENHVGEIQIRGASVTRGFYRDEAGTAEAFTGDGWLDTGDVGFIQNGELIITGRTKDIIFVNGQNYYPHDLETIALNADPYLELGKIVAYGLTQDVAKDSELIFFVVFRNDLKMFVPLVRNISRTINEQTGLVVSKVIPVNRVPKTTSGKIQRHHLGAAYINGDFNEPLEQLQTLMAPFRQDAIDNANNTETVDVNSTEAYLLKIFNEAMESKTLGKNDNLFEIGISSLALTELHEKIDVEYPGRLDLTDLFDLPTITEIAKRIDTNT